MRYAVFVVATGQITKVVQCDPTNIGVQLAAGEGAMAMASGDDATHYIANDSAIAMPARPSQNHVFDYASKAWVDPRTLQDRKNAAWETIKAAREAVIDANLATPYGTFDCKVKDRTNITDAVLLLQTLAALGTPTTIDFTLADNSSVTLTTSEMVTVGLLLGQKVQAAHGIARGLRTQIEAATSVAEVEAITWPAT